MYDEMDKKPSDRSLKSIIWLIIIAVTTLLAAMIGAQIASVVFPAKGTAQLKMICTGPDGSKTVVKGNSFISGVVDKELIVRATDRVKPDTLLNYDMRRIDPANICLVKFDQ